jgi:small subunit ribosomal protein S17
MAERKQKPTDSDTPAEEAAVQAETAAPDAPTEPAAEADAPGVAPPAEAATESAPEAQAKPGGEAPEEEPVAEASTAEPSAEAEAEPASDEPAAAPTEGAPEAQVKKKRKRLPRVQRRQRPQVKREPAKERKPIVRLAKPEGERGRTQERRGVVVSSAMDKTIVVRVDTLKAHPHYKKIIRRSTKLHAHDERNEAKVGDVVRIVEGRPLSKTKRWRLAEIIEVAK